MLRVVSDAEGEVVENRILSAVDEAVLSVRVLVDGVVFGAGSEGMEVGMASASAVAGMKRMERMCMLRKCSCCGDLV